MAEEGLSLRRSIWVSSLITLLGLAVFVGISVLIPRPVDSTSVLLVSLFLALVPAVIWLVFFYQQDRSEPEPKRLVVRVFVFGALAAAAVAVPVASQIASQAIEQFSNVFVRLLLTILSISLLQETLKVAMVRYVVLGTNEFDRHPDGIVYGLASGIGFATILTISFVIRSGGVIPLAGAIRAVDNVLVHGALGAVSGYYIGRVKIDGKNLGWMVRGLAIVTVVNGLYQILVDELANSFFYTPWSGLIVAVTLALVVGGILFAFFRRALLRATGVLSTVSVQLHARSKDMPWDIHVRYDYLLIGALLLSLVTGWGASIFLNSRTMAYQSDLLSLGFRYPAGWTVPELQGDRLALRDLRAGSAFQPLMTIESSRINGNQPLDLLVAPYITSYAERVSYYTSISNEPLHIHDDPAIQIVYHYATSTGGGPVIVDGVVTYVQVGARLYIFRYEADTATFENYLSHYERLLQTVHFETAQQ